MKIGYEQQSATDDTCFLPDDTPQMFGQFVRLIDVALCHMYVIGVCHIAIRQPALYLPIRPHRHNLKVLLGFVDHVFPNEEIHHTCNRGHHCQYHNHDA